MKANALIEKFKEKLLKLKGLEKLYFLVIERDKLDSGIFSQLGWRGTDFKEVLVQMLEKGDIADNMLEKYFDDYKENWDQAKRKYFDSTGTLELTEFLKSFKEYLPQDIIASIKKVKDTNLDDLKLKDSIRIFQNYYDLRNWMNKEIQAQLDEHKLTDREVQMMIGAIQDKYEWQGTSVELVGILQELETKNWLLNPIGSLRGKAQLLLSCFTIIGTKDSVEYIKKIYKEQSWDNKPFNKIQERT
jgi:hypothetical protein